VDELLTNTATQCQVKLGFRCFFTGHAKTVVDHISTVLSFDMIKQTQWIIVGSTVNHEILDIDDVHPLKFQHNIFHW